MTIKTKVGLEAEFLLLNDKGEAIIPPASWDRDGFPLLGEIRGEPGENVAQTLSNFATARFGIEDKLRKNHKIVSPHIFRVPLKLYKQANREINADNKAAELDKIINLYGTDITDFSDQVIKGGKIQGINVSCGLHVHFSCEEVDEVEVEEDEYKHICIPLEFMVGKVAADQESGIKELMRPYISLYEHTGSKKKKVLKARASRLNKPAIEYIVRTMDDKYFKKFSPPKDECTKYRQPGFFELKPYGFEYRSLPASDAVMVAMPEIVKFCFEMLKDINSNSWSK